MISFPNESAGLAYVFYEKTGRICLFCEIMFHDVHGWPLRNQIILRRHRKGVLDGEIPSRRFGEWITDPKFIPLFDSTNGSAVNTKFSTLQNLQLSRLQHLFADDEKGLNMHVKNSDLKEQHQMHHGRARIDANINERG